MLTIVMYHYVRDLARSRFPGIKALAPEAFELQLDELAGQYSIVSQRDVVCAAKAQGTLPANALLLTFDDGFRDHTETVLPALLKRGMSAGFYPPARPVLENVVLDVHKIHFILAGSRVSKLLASIERELADLAEAHPRVAVPTFDDLRLRFWSPNRFDAADVAFVKRILQHGLPLEVRSSLVVHLFARFVTSDEEAFAAELYMSPGELRQLLDCGMGLGGHGYSHEWLGPANVDRQRAEIRGSREFLQRISGQAASDWVMCYPYGSYNAMTIEILRDEGGAVGLTTEVGTNDLPLDAFELKRIDTKDVCRMVELG